MRHIALGNQQLLVMIDKWLQIRDIYFPFVGQYNHLMGHAHTMGILEGSDLSWINTDSWEKNACYLNETLTTNSTAVHKAKKLAITFNENVFCEDNIFFRKITIKNESDSKRTIRFIFRHDFHLYSDGIGDTAYYEPTHEAIIHYKKSVYFLIGLCTGKKGLSFSDFEIGYGIKPSWHMSKKPIAQGNVNSIVGHDITLSGNSSKSFTYYFIVGKNQHEVTTLQKKFLTQGVAYHLNHTKECQREWLSNISPNISLLPKRIQDLYKRSLLIIKTQIDNNGAITAANDSDNMQFNRDTYSYLWPRDGALVAIALCKAGFAHKIKHFFEFCKHVMEPEGYLLHKYNPDGTLGSSWHPWIHDGKPSLPIQEDETALVLYALSIYYDHTKDKKFIVSLYKDLIKPMAHFLGQYRYKNGLPKESYDLWEERRGIFTFTTATVLAGLIAADKLGAVIQDKQFCESCNYEFTKIRKGMLAHLYNEEKGYFRRSVSFEDGKMNYDDAMDSSVYALSEFGAFDAVDDRVFKTMVKMKEWLSVKTSIGGIARYCDDNYHQKSKDLNNVPGNPWFICTMWYAKWVIRKAQKKSDLKEALELIQWAADKSLSTGVMSEQIDPYTGEPLSVSPLTWSHAEFVDCCTDYVNKLEGLKG